MRMKRVTASALLFAGLTTGAFASSGIVLTAPQITYWSGLNGLTAAQQTTALKSINDALTSEFQTVQANLNSDSFNQLGGLNQLTQGFANANSAVSDDASLMSFQTYDLFSVMLGTNIGAALPNNPTQVASSLANVASQGDLYAGLATGGFAGQVGINLGFLVPDLYVSVKAGFFPQINVPSANTTVDFAGNSLGFGVNYTLVKPVDFVVGLLKWRGVSVGTGLTYTSNTTNVTTTLADQSSAAQKVILNLPGVLDPTVSAAATNTKAKLTVTDTSVVIPLEVMTSVQALWLFNIGFGAGLDIAFSGTKVGIGGTSDLGLTGLPGTYTENNGSAVITVADSKGNGAILIPRLAASLGLDLAFLKVDVPFSYYPTTQAFAVGISTGIVW